MEANRIVKHRGILPCIEAQVHMLPTEQGNDNPQGFIVKCIKEMPRIGEAPVSVGRLSICKNWSTGVLEYHKPQHLYISSNEDPKKGEWCYHKTSKEIILCPHGAFPKGHARKIIATTDPKLTLHTPPSQDFIEAYVKAQGNINKILVEIETKPLMPPCDVYSDTVTYIKVDYHNTITIHPVNPMTPEEAVLAYREYAWVNGLSIHDCTQWIKDNICI